MHRYQATPPPVLASFPIDPATNFQSSYPLGFASCMYCNDPNHVFRQCPGNGTPSGALAIFYSNLFAHKPHLRKRAPMPHEILA